MEKNFETTFLISTYNNVEYIEECLDSIENQTYFKDNTAKFQVLIGVDGCPKTYEKIVEIKDKYRNLDVYNLHKNMGAYIALNTLIPYIKYDNVVIFGSDDVMEPEAVDILSKVDNQYDIVKFLYKVFQHNIENVVSKATATAAGAIMVRKRVFDMCGGYHHNRFSSDFELLTRLRKFTKTINLNNYIFYYRAHEKSLTTTVNKSKRIQFDNMVRSTNYTKDNVKIEPIVARIKDSFTTSKENVV